MFWQSFGFKVVHYMVSSFGVFGLRVVLQEFGFPG